VIEKHAMEKEIVKKLREKAIPCDKQ
jgi:hypothetical protein